MKTNLRAGSQSATTFTRFMRSLGADRARRTLFGILIALVFLGAWIAWLFLARVTVYEITESARIESEGAGYTVESAVAGRVVSTRLKLGREVKAGDALAELDTDEQRLKLEEERTRLRSVGPQIDAIAGEVAAEERALANARLASVVALEEARSRVEEAEVAAQFAVEEARRLGELFAQGYVAELVILKARSDAKGRRAAVESLKLNVSRMERDQQTVESERRVRIEKLLRERRELEAARASSASAIERLQGEIERRTIRSPVSGQLGEVTTSKEGAVVGAGDKLGTVVPAAGALRIIAEFTPSALGRVREGQAARMRLTSFPWTQYGSLPARVTRVAGEVRDGKIRVELSVETPEGSPLPVQHGLPGSIEVEVETVAPATLLLRAVKILTRPSAGNNGNRGGAG